MIDVREPYEHDEFSLGGQNLPLGEIMQWSSTLDCPADSEIVVYCRSGNRSAMAQSFLHSLGFTAVRNLIGGVVAWQKME
jgi:rhodanese-related sulfurtransferase